MPRRRSAEREPTKKDFKEGVSVILDHCLRYQFLFFSLVLVTTILAVLSSVQPYIVGKILDSVINIQDMLIFGISLPDVYVYISMYALILFLYIILKFFGGRFGMKLMMLITKDHRIESMEKLLKYPVSYFKSQKNGEIHEVIGRANSALSQMVGYYAPYFGVQIFSLLFAFGIAFTISPVLTGVLILGVFLFITSIVLITPALQKVTKKINKALDQVQADYYEIITNIFEVKRNTTEESELKKIKKGYGIDVYNAGIEEEYLWITNTAVRTGITYGTQVLVFLISIPLIMNETITPGQLIAMNLYAQLVFDPLSRLSDMWLFLTRSIIKIKEGQDLLEKDKEPHVIRNKDTPLEIRGGIEFRDVRFRYQEDEQEVLRGISFSARSGETIALVGESGVGKSTTIELIGGFYFAQKGEVLIDGVPITELPLNFVRSNIGYVSQEVTLFNDTVYNNIIYGANRKVTKEEVYEACRQARADIFINSFDKGYKQLVGERGVKLSVGQKQRIAIARTILRNPKILILDEPTSALDSKTEKHITTALKKLMKDRTTFIIAHRLSTVRDADTILVYKAGKIAERGNHEDLMKMKGHYAEMYNEHIGLT